MLIRFLTALAMVAALAGVAPTHAASAQNLDDKKDIRLGADALKVIADSRKLKWRMAKTPTKQVLVLTENSGLQIVLSFVGCDNEAELSNCDGMQMQAGWPFPTNGTPSEIATRLNEMNQAYSAIKVGSQGSNVYMSRYIIGDHGTKQGNLSVEIGLFLQFATLFRQRILKSE